MADPVAQVPYMPDYGVGDGWRPLPWSWAAERLAATRNFWLVTAAADGRPHSMPVWGVWDDGEHRFAFGCGPRSRKARNLAENPRAVVTNDDTGECVSVEGLARFVTDPGRQDRWIGLYLEKYRPMSPGLSAGFLREGLLVELAAERAFAVVEREDEFSTRATRWVF